MLEQGRSATEPTRPTAATYGRPADPLSPIVVLPAAAVVLLLMAVADRYGFHRDELYFIEGGHHPAWAQPDNPMLVPLLAAGWHDLVAGRLWAFRLLPALAAGGFVLLGAVLASELGGRPRHQVAAAVGTAMTSLVLATGHLFSTLTFDMAVSAAALWLLLAAVRTDRWAVWLLLGLTVGIAMEIKIMAMPLIGCCLLGMIIAGPRRLFVRPRLWAAAVIAAVLAAPNLLWQAAHGWPMVQIARSIAGGGSTSSADRATVVPLHLLMIGPVICVVLIAGVVWLLRRRSPARWLAIGYLLFLGIVVATGGKPYYPAAFLPALLAAGAIAVLDWILDRRPRRVAAVLLLACSAIITLLLTLPIAPVGSPLFRIAAGVNPDSAETVGWDGYLSTVAGVVATVPADRRSRTVIITRNYGEAGMLSRVERQRARTRVPFGARLPPVYSGHNGYAAWGPPPADTSTAIMVGAVDPGRLQDWFTDCRTAATLVSPAGVDNEENGAPVRVCTGPRAGLDRLWPEMTHLS